jgi:hypothetical protein
MTHSSATEHKLKSVKLEEVEEAFSKTLGDILGGSYQCSIMTMDFAGDDTRIVLTIRKPSMGDADLS